jgi:hypothetical protein
MQETPTSEPAVTAATEEREPSSEEVVAMLVGQTSITPSMESAAAAEGWTAA